MLMHCAVSALVLCTVGAVRTTEDIADETLGADKTKEFHPETDESILQRIRNFRFEADAEGSGLPALVPRSEEGVCGYYFGIHEAYRGAQTWYMSGMRVSRKGDRTDCEDVKITRINLANLRWDDRGSRKRFVVRSAASPEEEVLTIRQEASGKYLFRLLPPGSDDAAETSYQFENDDKELYSGSQAYKHHWTVYRGDQKEEKAVDVACNFRYCGLERFSEDGKMRWMGGTEQHKADDPEKVLMKRKDVLETDVEVDVSFDQDAGLILAFASTMTHKYVPPRKGITGAVISTISGGP